MAFKALFLHDKMVDEWYQKASNSPPIASK
jgi:hypothetical protein